MVNKGLNFGLGDIGKNLAKRLLAHDVEVLYHDPYVSKSPIVNELQESNWPQGLSDVDFVIFTAPLNSETFHCFNTQALEFCKTGIKVINVGRGPLIDEKVLIKGLETNVIAAAALDVFEVEPFSLETHKKLLQYRERLILGSHNGSNTQQAVSKVSKMY